MILSIHQPAYLPWLGYFDRIARSDMHVVLDHVQFEKNSFINRNKIMTAQGARWLSVPVQTRGAMGDLAIDALAIDGTQPWQKKHWHTLRQAYAHAPEWPRHAEALQPFYTDDYALLNQLLTPYLRYFLDALGIATPVQFSHDLALAQTKGALVLEICLQLGATTYLSGPLGRDYLDEAMFRDHGITITYHDYVHPAYAHAASPFCSHLSCLDLMMHHHNALEILSHGT